MPSPTSPESSIPTYHQQLFGQRKQREFIPDQEKDDTYWDRRRRNNEAAKRSREKRRVNDMMLESRVMELTKENNLLRAQLEQVYDTYAVVSRNTGCVPFQLPPLPRALAHIIQPQAPPPLPPPQAGPMPRLRFTQNNFSPRIPDMQTIADHQIRMADQNRQQLQQLIREAEHQQPPTPPQQEPEEPPRRIMTPPEATSSAAAAMGSLYQRIRSQSLGEYAARTAAAAAAAAAVGVPPPAANDNDTEGALNLSYAHSHSDRSGSPAAETKDGAVSPTASDSAGSAVPEFDEAYHSSASSPGNTAMPFKIRFKGEAAHLQAKRKLSESDAAAAAAAAEQDALRGPKNMKLDVY